MSVPGATLGSLILLAVAGLVSCAIVLILPLELFLALLAVLTFVVQGCLGYFFGISRAAWLPYALCVLALIRVPFGSPRATLAAIARARGLLAFTLAALALYVVILIAALVLNRPPAGQTLAGLKAALPFWVIAALLLVDVDRERSHPRLWKLFYAIFFLQVPLVVFQHVYVIPRRADAMTTGMDAVVGSFGGHMHAGGANATLVIFALLIMAHQVARFLRRIGGGGQLAGIAAVGMTIILAGEVMGVFVWMPLLAVFLVRRHGWEAPLRSALVLGSTVAALGLTFVTYDRLYWGKKGHTSAAERISQMWSHVADPSRVNYATHNVSRAASVALWLADDEVDAARRVIGYGPGAAHLSATVGPGEVAKRFAPLRVSPTAAAALLWDSGVLGLLSFASILAGALGMAMQEANRPSVRPDQQARLDALGALLLVFCSLLLYSRALIAEPSTQLLLALAVGYAGCQSMRRAAPSHESSGVSAMASV